MRYDTASSTYTLQIKDVQRPDEGTYQCQIIVAINNKVTRHVRLDVSQPPVIADNSTRYVKLIIGKADDIDILHHKRVYYLYTELIMLYNGNGNSYLEWELL